eukprot:1262579-Rhodomonas_salina.2
MGTLLLSIGLDSGRISFDHLKGEVWGGSCGGCMVPGGGFATTVLVIPRGFYEQQSRINNTITAPTTSTGPPNYPPPHRPPAKITSTR